MCLLVVFHRVFDHWPLCVAANRDEMLARPASGMGVLEPAGPRIVGGRDELAGGTWLAINEHGVVAGLTNKPMSRFEGRRSRGQLPLLLARQPSARAAVAAFDIDAHDYNPCWMFVVDNDSMYYIDITGTGRPSPRQLSPGIHILENAPLDADTDKQRAVRDAVADHRSWEPTNAESSWSPDHFVGEIRRVIQSHDEPAACVHLDGYGTRSSAVIVSDPSPRVFAADGRPCTHEMTERPALWSPSPERS